MTGLVLSQAGAVLTLWICASGIWDGKAEERTRASNDGI